MLKHSEMFKEHGWSSQKLIGAPWGLLMDHTNIKDKVKDL